MKDTERGQEAGLLLLVPVTMESNSPVATTHQPPESSPGPGVSSLEAPE